MVVKVPEYLYHHQRDLIKAVLEADKGRWFVVKAFRQNAGKTFSLQNLIIFIALTRPESVSIFIEPTNAQCAKVAEETAKAAVGVGVRFNGSTNTLRFQNGSMVLFKSGESDPATVRGYTAKKGGIVIVDEASFIKDEYFNTLFPVVQKFKATLVLASTPDNQAGTFYNLYKKGENEQSTQNRVQSINWSKYLHEMFTEEELEFYRSIYSARRFRTEVLGEFSDSDGEVFKKVDKAVRDGIDLYGRIDLVSVDWGSGQGKDYTAVCYWNEKKELIKLDYFNELSPVEQIEKLTSQWNEIRPRKVIVEQNSIGAVYLDMIKRGSNGYRVEGFQTDNRSKNRIIDKLAAGFEHELIHMPKHEELIHELACYEEQTTKSGQRTYNARVGAHDDLVMAMAIGWDELNPERGHYSVRVH